MERTEPGRDMPKGTPRPILSDPKLISGLVRTQSAARIDLRSPAFEDGQEIPKRYTGEGDNISPPLEWGDIPLGAQAQLIVCEDPDAPRAEPFVHWILFNIGPRTNELDEGIAAVRTPPFPADAAQCANSQGSMGYMGPMPPPGHGVHHYHFQIFALDKPLLLPEHLTRQELISAIDKHVMGVGELVGTYER